MKKNVFACGLLTCVIFLQGCSAKAPSYKDNWSEARNLANAGGLMMGIRDRPASEAKAPYSGPGVGLGDLIAIANVGVGALEGGVLGMGGAGSAAFNAAHGVWAVSDSDQWSANRFFAYVPQNQAHNQAEARKLLEDKLLSNFQCSHRFALCQLLATDSAGTSMKPMSSAFFFRFFITLSLCSRS